DGARMVAGASTYRWLGLVDVGVLTDPAYRGQGLGKAVVSAVAQHVAAQGHVVCYRHAVYNTGSQGIAEGLRFSLDATTEGVHPVTLARPRARATCRLPTPLFFSLTANCYPLLLRNLSPPRT